MRKHFLILMLMALLPLSCWAISFQDPTVTISANDAAYNTPIATIKAGITVKINNEALDAANWTWDGTFYATSAAATAKDATGLVAPAAGFNTPDAETYYIRIEPTTSANSDYKVIPLIIRQASLVVGVDKDYVAATAKTPTYDGTAQTLINAATYGTTGSLAKCGAITYAIGTKVGDADPTDDGATYSADLPTATAAATYYVFYKFAGSKNYAEVKGYVAVTIAAKNINALTAPTQGENFVMANVGPFIYNGKTDQLPSFTVKDKDTEITSSVQVYWFPNATDFTDIADVDLTAAVAPKNVGTYKALLVGTGNYGGRKADASWTFNIDKKELRLIINNLESEYNGQAVNLNDAKITYLGLCSTDFSASLDNFGGKFNVQFGSGAAPTNVKRNGTAVDGYALEIGLVDGYATTSLYTNYQLKNEDGTNVTFDDNTNPTKITNVAGTYTITPIAVTYKARDIEMEYGSAAPVAPAAATLDDAEANPAVVGTVEITSGAMVEGESILAALTFTVAEKAKTSPATAWNVATVGNYASTLTLGMLTQANITAMEDGDAKTAAQAAFNAAQNYTITYTKGGVEVVGKSLTVYVYGTSVEYGTDLTNYNPGYYASGKTLGGNLVYTICDVTTEEPIEDLENLAIGTYLVKLDKTQITNPANYNVTVVEPGFLEVAPKKITITINPLILNPGTTQAQLNGANGYASVVDTYKTNLVGDDAEVTFTFSFNSGDAEGQIPAAKMNGTALGDESNGEYAKGITATIIAWDNTKNMAQNIEAGWVAANENYDVTFVPGALTVVTGNVLYLTETDDYLLDKIKTAATAATPYAINFGSRELQREVWAPMVLPFETSVKEISEAMGYAVVDVLDVTENSSDMHLKLHMGKIAANQPFIVKYYMEDVEEELYTEAEANAYNYTLDGARKTTDVKTPAQDATYYTTVAEYNEAKGTALDETAFNALSAEEKIKTPATAAVYYTQAECDTYNATLNGAKHAGDVKVEAEDHSKLNLNTVNAFAGKTIVYDADADYVNEDGNVFVQNANNGHQFIGVYNPVEVYGANYKWISKKGALVDGGNYTVDKKAPMRRLIAYFKLNTANGNARILIDEPDGTTTVINAVTAETMNVQADGWYTLNGVKLQSIPTQKGIYINNGKKVVIK